MLVAFCDALVFFDFVFNKVREVGAGFYDKALDKYDDVKKIRKMEFFARTRARVS